MEARRMTLTLRCPVCGFTVRDVRARRPTATCVHVGSIHDAKKPALMVIVAVDQKVPA